MGYDASMMKNLVQYLKSNGLLQDENIAKAFLKIDRADFVPERVRHLAYSDQALPIGEGQTISQPTVVAFMLELLYPKLGDRILDVGAGSGWQTALLAEMVSNKGQVFAIEVVPQLYWQARKNVAEYKFKNLHFFCQNARAGLPKQAPFDGIIAGAAGENIPPAWKKQLKVGGRIVAPVGNSVFCYTKKSDNKFITKEYPGFLFVPLID